MSADDELSNALERRNDINEGKAKPKFNKKIPIATEFKEFSFKEIQQYTAIFRKWEKKSGAGDGEIDFENLKRLMESLGCPQTHLELKRMLKEVNDSTETIDIYEFFHIFRMGRSGDLTEGSGLYNLYAQISEIDVAKEGVASAADFFEAKVRQATAANQWELEIREDQEQKRKENEEKKKRQEEFKAKANLFQ